MKRKHQAYLFSVITIIIILAALYGVIAHFGQKASLIYLAPLIAVPIIIAILISPLRNQHIENEALFNPALPARNVILIILTQCLSYIFFFSAAQAFLITLLPHENAATLNQTLLKFYQKTFHDFAFFPWALGILFIFCLNYIHKTTPHNRSPLPFPITAKSRNLNMFSQAFYNAFRLGLLLLISMSIAFFALLLSKVVFGVNSIVNNSFISGILVLVIMFFSLNKKNQDFVKKLEKKKHGVFYIFSLFTVSIIILTLIANLALFFLIRHHHPTKPLLLNDSYIHLSGIDLFQFFMSFWWLTAMPFLASLIWQLLPRTKLYQVLFYTLPMPIIIQLFSSTWIHWVSQLTQQNPISFLIVQGLLLALIASFLWQSHAGSTLWLGYLNHRQIKPRLRYELFGLITVVIMAGLLLQAYAITALIYFAYSICLLLAILSLCFRFIR